MPIRHTRIILPEQRNLGQQRRSAPSPRLTVPFLRPVFGDLPELDGAVVRGEHAQGAVRPRTPSQLLDLLADLQAVQNVKLLLMALELRHVAVPRRRYRGGVVRALQLCTRPRVVFVGSSEEDDTPCVVTGGQVVAPAVELDSRDCISVILERAAIVASASGERELAEDLRELPVGKLGRLRFLGSKGRRVREDRGGSYGAQAPPPPTGVAHRRHQ